DDPPPAVVDALIAAHDRGARLAAISTGAKVEGALRSDADFRHRDVTTFSRIRFLDVAVASGT
ncbi:hypothetical protein, partial [Streptomyces sp900116325]|uniref:hypothetical protein n=1 Tax=Streptomyces sp. 900116325 TaxID=3154295 RepID=UPI0033A71086